MVLYEHDGDFSILINKQDLMHSRRHESELELARLGCAHLSEVKAPCVLIGGLGMGYTLRQTLDLLDAEATVVVAELLATVVAWNREFLGGLNGQPLQDARVEIKTGDIVELIAGSLNRFDAILLDIDNGPTAITDSGNRRLYTRQGIHSCRRALRDGGVLAVWSSEPCRVFEKTLRNNKFQVQGFRVSAYKGSRSKPCYIWVATEDPARKPF